MKAAGRTVDFHIRWGVVNQRVDVLENTGKHEEVVMAGKKSESFRFRVKTPSSLWISERAA